MSTDNSVGGVSSAARSPQDVASQYDAYQRQLDEIHGPAQGDSAAAFPEATSAQDSAQTIASRPTTWGASEAKDPGQRLRPGVVAEEVTVVMQTFIPYRTVGPVPNLEPGSIMSPPTPTRTWVHGDGAHHTQPGTDDSYLDNQGFRTQQVITLQYDASGTLLGYKDVTKRVGESVGFADEAGTQLQNRDTASADSLKQTIKQSADGSTIIQFDNETSIPSSVVPVAPGITNRSTVMLRPHGGPNAELPVQVAGEHDRFPAYEVVVRRQSAGHDSGWTLVHGSHPADYGDGKYGIGPELGLTLPPVPTNSYDAPPVMVPSARP